MLIFSFLGSIVKIFFKVVDPLKKILDQYYRKSIFLSILILFCLFTSTSIDNAPITIRLLYVLKIY